MVPPIIKDSGKLLHEQVYEFYRDAILSRSLKPGYRLPSHRVLAGELGLSNNTIIRAYEQLAHEGYIKSESKRGYFVCELEALGVKGARLEGKGVMPASGGRCNSWLWIVSFSNTIISLSSLC